MSQSLLSLTVIRPFQSQRPKKRMQENKQESTRVCHALRHTFSKLSPAHDMKAIIDLACFPYNLDRAFSRTGYEKKKKNEKMKGKTILSGL